MKRPGFLAVLAFILLGWSCPVQAGQPAPCTFLSPLQYTGHQWQVKSAVGPIFLARLEGGVWQLLACFDGTNGKYHLAWDHPKQGVYAAVDPSGMRSDVVTIGSVGARTPQISPAAGRAGSAASDHVCRLDVCIHSRLAMAGSR